MYRIVEENRRQYNRNSNPDIYDTALRMSKSKAHMLYSLRSTDTRDFAVLA